MKTLKEYILESKEDNNYIHQILVHLYEYKGRKKSYISKVMKDSSRIQKDNDVTYTLSNVSEFNDSIESILMLADKDIEFSMTLKYDFDHYDKVKNFLSKKDWEDDRIVPEMKNGAKYTALIFKRWKREEIKDIINILKSTSTTLKT